MDKTRQLLAYIIKNHPSISITGLMKLAYISDLVSIKKHNKQISDFQYIRYIYGPFNTDIYAYIKSLVDQGVILEYPDYTPRGDEFIIYKYNKDTDFSFAKLTKKDRQVIDEVIESLLGYGAMALVDLSYKTKPMIKIGAKQGNGKGLNEKLDLWAD